MSAPNPYAPGWYPDGTGVLRYFDGYQWTGYTDGPPPKANNTNVIVTLAIAGLTIIGIFLNLSSVSLISGTDKVWVGVGFIVVAAVLCVVPRRVHGAAITAVVLVLALAVSNAIYDEVQLQHKRDQFEQLVP